MVTKKHKVYKYLALVLTAVGYSSLHMGRTGWPYIKNSVKWINNDFRALIDFGFLIAYAFGMLVAGPIGERLNVKYFYVFGLVSTATCYLLTGLLGLLGINS